MPVGIVVSCCAVLVGGLLGALIGPVIPERIKKDLNLTFGFIALALGISLITKICNMGAVALTMIISMLMGSILDINGHLESGVLKLNRKLRLKGMQSPENVDKFGLLVVLFAFGCTSIMGPVMAVKTGDNMLLLCKAVMDFFTALLFGSIMGTSVSLIAIPQFATYMIGLLCAHLAADLLTGEVYGDFEGVGGVISLFAGMKLLGVCDIKAANAIFALVLIVPVSNLWQLIF